MCEEYLSSKEIMQKIADLKIRLALQQEFEQEVDELVDLIVETLMLPDTGTIRIGGKERPVPIVKSMFLKLDKDHICYILKCLHNTEKKIGNIKAYLLTALYNAPMTIQNYYTNLANCDLASDSGKN